MSWIVLVLSGVLESVWAAALTATEGFTRLWPSVVFGVALAFSMAGLGWALRTIPLGTGYAVWVGIGVVGTALWGIVALGEPVTVARIVCLVAIVGGIVGLKLTSGH
ncbi:DMT family transporter [Serinicoccus kebangsaanensis]|uniref:DMT family transporter n=1 Tax=Serinicoccus kebangsaanensis TaxID=2602069 RepID=UPI00124E406A|nr:SMR family transporter [Serinicoccus kebangsaanensis]